MQIPLWQKLIGCIVYLIPLSDAMPFGGNLFSQFPILQYIILPALPIIFIERIIPFGGFILFLGLFIGVIRNQKIPYFIRFNSLQALLIDIILILLGYAFQILFTGLRGTTLIETLSSTIFIAMLSIIIFTSIECLKGQEPDLPGISEAVKIQL